MAGGTFDYIKNYFKGVKFIIFVDITMLLILFKQYTDNKIFLAENISLNLISIRRSEHGGQIY
jgi:hypothetical protein